MLTGEPTTAEERAPSSATPPRSVAPRGDERAARVVAVAVLVGIATLHTIVVWPGRMSNDTLTQISLVRSGQYTDWHAALLLILWRPFWLLGVGPGLVTWASTVAFVAGLYLIVRSAWSRSASIAATVLLCAYPPVLGHIGYLGRDQWFMALFLLSVGALLRLARAPSARWRLVWMVLGFVWVWLMVASRQNALPVAGILFAGAAATAGPWRRLGRFDRTTGGRGRTVLARVVRVAAAFTVFVVLVLSQAAMKAAFHVDSSHPEQATYLYDLAALSVREHQVLFSPGIYPAQDLATLEANFSPTVVNTLLFGPAPPLPFPVPAGQEAALRDDWLSAVLDHPRGYMAIRLELWKTQVAWTGKTEWIYHPFVDPNPWGYEVSNPSLDEPLQDYLQSTADQYLRGGPLYEVWVYLAFTVLGLGYLRHGDPARQVLGWCCFASLVYQATIFVGAMGVGYRLTYPSVVVVLAVAVVGLRDVVLFSARDGDVPRRAPNRVRAPVDPGD